ncbi:MAG: glucosaminidase domain-containing protein [Bacteroidales bacterium]|nr:glucosaminidase domain-containing protein [Bacteroidales bacterium]MDT8431650.1 glucosaminidase domain-containing protein [Bacteroidales bacterium]
MLGKQLLIVVLITWSAGVDAQGQMSRDAYIQSYADIAMKEMVRAGIPASIKLAQGCLESDNGNSRLARSAKNHFGIKCHDWTGRKIHHDDDERNECFRRYRTVNDSYIDHSDFLTSKPRYAELFLLQKNDYKGWANGLKKAGYATNRQYAELLIRIIEENELYKYDEMVLAGRLRPGRPDSPVSPGPAPGASREILVNNRIDYIIAQPGDTPDGLREEFDLYPGELFRNNDISRDTPLEPGMVIYLQPKRWRAERGNETHIVQEGQTMWEISQIYCVKLGRLYRINYLKEDAEPEPGTGIWLRRRKPDENLFRNRLPGPEEEVPAEDSTEMEFEFDG